ncbi:MAG TPA: MlaD family protein [Paucimonas sp.]|nr:MlaD family protein [Paucimonas sp.]
MENKAHALIAGVFTLVLLAAAVFIALWLNRDRDDYVPYEIATKLSIPGLNPQAAVRYRGLDVGKVDDIVFDPKVPGQILVRMSVKPDTPVTRSTYGTLGYQGVTGIAYVELDDEGTNPERLPSAKGRVARIEMRPSLFDTLQNRGLAILVQTEEITKRLNGLLSDEHQRQMLGAFDKVGKAADEIEAIPRQLQPTLAKLPALTSEMQLTLSSVGRLAKEATALTGNLNATAAQLNAPDGPIAKLTTTLDQAQSEMTPLARDARSSLRALNRTLDNLNNQPQSILFGNRGIAPGPGEDGFDASGK